MDQLNSYREELEAEMEAKFPGVKKEWESLTSQIAPDIHEFLKEQIQEEIIHFEGYGSFSWSPKSLING